MIDTEDVFGQALDDYYHQKQEGDLLVHTTYGDPELVPIEGYFYEKEDFSELELIALEHCHGDVLDIGAGSGKHSLALNTKNIYPLDFSFKCCYLMKTRGLSNVIKTNLLDYSERKFDTLLLLQNGIGLVGDLDGLEVYLNHFKSLLEEGGQVLFDSSNIDYLYDDLKIQKSTENYYGEMTYQYEYRNIITTTFKWLYLDFDLLQTAATKNGWVVEKIFEDEFDQYLVRMFVS